MLKTKSVKKKEKKKPKGNNGKTRKPKEKKKGTKPLHVGVPPRPPLRARHVAAPCGRGGA